MFQAFFVFFIEFYKICEAARHALRRETFPVLFLALFLSVYTGPDKFLQGRILYLDRLFTWNGANSVTDGNVVLHGSVQILRPVAAFVISVIG